MRTRLFLTHAAATVVLLGASAAVSRAQVATIDSGMTKAQVVEKFGKPASERTRGDFTYLFFGNGRESQVGMADLVILRSDHVVDAILRSPNRAYSGTSSSPKALNSKEAKGAGSGAPLKRGGASG